MVKKIFILLLALTVIAGFWLLVSFSNSDDPGSVSNEEVQTTPVQPQVSDLGLSVPTSSLPQTNLTNGAITVLSDTGQRQRLPLDITSSEEEVLDEGLSILLDNSEWQDYFDIAYYEPTGSITIYLHELPLSFARDVAVQELVAALGVEQAELCSLNITVQTNEFVSLEYTGYDLGVPGCPSAVNLP